MSQNLMDCPPSCLAPTGGIRSIGKQGEKDDEVLRRRVAFFFCSVLESVFLIVLTLNRSWWIHAFFECTEISIWDASDRATNLQYAMLLM
jgi:hypothetical protein